MSESEIIVSEVWINPKPTRQGLNEACFTIKTDNQSHTFRYETPENAEEARDDYMTAGIEPTSWR